MNSGTLSCPRPGRDVHRHGGDNLRCRGVGGLCHQTPNSGHPQGGETHSPKHNLLARTTCGPATKSDGVTTGGDKMGGKSGNDRGNASQEDHLGELRAGKNKQTSYPDTHEARTTSRGGLTNCAGVQVCYCGIEFKHQNFPRRAPTM